MKREEALDLLYHYIKNPRTISHCIASEAVMRHLALRLNENPEQWGLAGLLHDLDVEVTQGDMSMHTVETARILAHHAVDNEVVEAIMSHNEHAGHNLKRTRIMHHALAAGETITGLIIATAMVYPDKKLRSVKPNSIIKRMKEKAFAAGVCRETILECETLGIPLEEFVTLSLVAMQHIADDLGL